MAHEIDLTTGKAAMAYVGEKPWHGLGQELSAGASIEEWIKEAGMEWEAKTSPAIYVDGDDVFDFDGKNIIYRNDTRKPLGIVSDRYKIVQPAQVMEFFRDLTADAGFTLETAGCLFDGKKLWAMAKTGESVKIAGVDEIKPYLLLGTSMDGTMATAAHFTSVRVVCNNTLRMAIGANGKKAMIKVPHLADFNAQSVKEQLGLAADTWGNFIEEVEILAAKKITRDEAIETLAFEIKDSWVIDDRDMFPAEMVETSRDLKEMIQLFGGAGIGSNLISAKGTAWGLVNAVTEYFDHRVTSQGADRSRVLDRAQFGDRANFKTNVANKLLDL